MISIYQISQYLGHAISTNFRSRRVYRGQEQTVAIDWAQAGIAPLGDDLGQLVYGTCMNLKAYKMQDISQTLFTSYINGLQDSGCRVEPEIVRSAYVSHSGSACLSCLCCRKSSKKMENGSIPI
jgi:hypothetical protein